MSAQDKFPVVKSSDMTDEMLFAVQELINEAVQKYLQEMDIAGYIKKECDRQFKPAWQVLVGRNYACFISHLDQNFLYMHQHGLSFLVFKTS